MRREDHYTNTPEDAAQFERDHADFDPEDEPPSPRDVLSDYELYEYAQYRRIVPRHSRGFRVPSRRVKHDDDRD